MLTCTNLSVSRNDISVFIDVSFSVADGEMLVLSGANGVGKSTLLHALAGLPDVLVTAGDIVDGEGSLIALAPHERFVRGIMLIFQDPPPLPGVSFLTVAREMLFARTGVRPEIAPLYQEIRKVFARVGFDESFIERPLFEGFSGGEKKRGELALLLLARPKIVLLDEIDAGLDADGRKVAQEVIRELLVEGSSIICVTHSTDFLADFSEKKICSL